MSIPLIACIDDAAAAVLAGAAEHQLPKVFDLQRVLTDQLRLQFMFDHGGGAGGWAAGRAGLSAMPVNPASVSISTISVAGGVEAGGAHAGIGGAIRQLVCGTCRRRGLVGGGRRSRRLANRAGAYLRGYRDFALLDACQTAPAALAR
jgi:hypothetical protein